MNCEICNHAEHQGPCPVDLCSCVTIESSAPSGIGTQAIEEDEEESDDSDSSDE